LQLNLFKIHGKNGFVKIPKISKIPKIPKNLDTDLKIILFVNLDNYVCY